MTKLPLRIGIAGFGVVGQRRHQFIQQRPDMVTVAVCDRTLPGDGELDDGVRFHKDYTALLKEDLDALFVCLTNDIAAEVTIAGLNAGLHVFCKKPPGRNLEDISRVVECSKAHPKLKLKYGFNHRYHDSIQNALGIVQSGEMGRVINLRGVYGKSKFISYGEPSDWRTRRQIAGGGILLDQGIHMVDLMRLFAGEFEQIHSFLSNAFWGYDVEDNAYALMRTREGVVAMLHSTATQWRHRFSLDVTLEKGAVNLSGILSGSKSYGEETLAVAWAANSDVGDPKEEITRYDHDPSWEREIAEFADVIFNDTPVISGSVDDALETMRLVYRIYCADPQWKARWGLGS